MSSSYLSIKDICKSRNKCRKSAQPSRSTRHPCMPTMHTLTRTWTHTSMKYACEANTCTHHTRMTHLCTYTDLHLTYRQTQPVVWLGICKRDGTQMSHMNMHIHRGTLQKVDNTHTHCLLGLVFRRVFCLWFRLVDDLYTSHPQQNWLFQLVNLTGYYMYMRRLTHWSSHNSK